MLELSSLDDDPLDCCGRPVIFGSGEAGVPAVVEVAMLQLAERRVSSRADEGIGTSIGGLAANGVRRSIAVTPSCPHGHYRRLQARFRGHESIGPGVARTSAPRARAVAQSPP